MVWALSTQMPPNNWNGDPEEYYREGHWLKEEASAMGWDEILGIPWRGGADWAMKHGIAPYQEFLIWIEPPTYTRDYWGEWDCEMGDYGIISKEIMGEEEIISEWEEMIKDMQQENSWSRSFN